MGTLHLLAGGGVGGIESLCKDYVQHSQNENTVVCIWSGGCVADEMRSLGADVVELQYHQHGAVKTLKRLIRICKERKIDVVITHHAAALAHIYMMALKILVPRVKTVVYVHSSAADWYDKTIIKGRWIRKSIFGLSLLMANHVIAISNSVAKSLAEEFHILPNKMQTIYNGVNIRAFAPQANKENDNTFKLIYVGRLVWAKGIQNTLSALSLLPKDINWSFTVVGEGHLRKKLEKKAISLGIQERVLFTGNRRDVSALLNESDCFVHLPNWEEGFGITILEAMAAGKICVCSKRGAIPEIIEDQKNGYLVPADATPSDVATALEFVWRNINSPEMEKLRHMAQERASDFSIERYTAMVDELVMEQR